jgi:hypothetical protein
MRHIDTAWITASCWTSYLSTREKRMNSIHYKPTKLNVKISFQWVLHRRPVWCCRDSSSIFNPFRHVDKSCCKLPKCSIKLYYCFRIFWCVHVIEIKIDFRRYGDVAICKFREIVSVIFVLQIIVRFDDKLAIEHSRILYWQLQTIVA